MNARRLVLCSASLCLCAGLAYWSGRGAFRAFAASPDVVVRPYVMKFVEFATKEGREEPLMVVTRSRRRDGAQHEYTVPYWSKQPLHAGVTLEFPDGTFVMVMKETHSKSTTQRTESVVARWKAQLMNSPPKCAYPGWTVESEEQLFGVRTIRTARSNSGQDRELRWLLPDFACEMAQQFTQKLSASGSWETVDGRRLLAFAEADPAPDLFMEHEGLDEVLPSEFQYRYYRHAGFTEKDCPKCFEPRQKEDAQYLATRPRWPK